MSFKKFKILKKEKRSTKNLWELLKPDKNLKKITINKLLKVRIKTLQGKNNKKYLNKLPKRFKAKIKISSRKSGKLSKIKVPYLSFKIVVIFSVEIQNKFYTIETFTPF